MRTDTSDQPRAPLAVAAAVFTVLGLWMVWDPAGFQATVGGFGTTNEHLIRDLATFNLALAAVLAVAARQPSWSVPILWFANVQNGLHLLNHIADADQAVPLWGGMANVWALLAPGAVLAPLLILARRPPRRANL